MPEILIDPLTRIMGNASVKIVLDEAENPRDARFQAFGYRGFDQIARGSHIDGLCPIVSRICGCDSLFHQLAAATAVENALGVEVPPEALRLRELALWGQLFERHAVSLTVHSLPDLLFPSSDPGLRNIISIHRVDEETVKRLMELKSLGTSVLKEAGGRAVHPVNFLPGGAVRDISADTRRALIDRLNEARPFLIETGRLVKLLLRRNEEAVNALGTDEAPSLSLRGEGGMAITGTALAVVDAGGEAKEAFGLEEAAERLREDNSPHSHIRSVELSGVGEVRVGPLARLNVNGGYGTALADEELEEVKAHWGFPLHRNMIGHAARILEMIHAWERMVELLALPGGEMMRRTLNPSGGSGEGAVEGPEGTLLYGLVLDEDGLVKRLSITTPLQFNLKSLERAVLESARTVLGSADTGERALVLLETAIRAFAPCIPCGVH
ncbi:MAG: nickel-dependent hydrogenase large subunit [Actinomycetota bacterium]|nr:nickel-dependent hydrogenase large subunit [Actinomycetota bacterium]MDD5665961.1 nickel-dependent hydrogenase large subunit [Actinomycetota bacterium]